jgi:hypothetical protein
MTRKSNTEILRVAEDVSTRAGVSHTAEEGSILAVGLSEEGASTNVHF